MHYYGTRLSENISRREPEGYLLCLNVPVARTGTQEYLASEIGLSGTGVVPVYRPEEEVFAPETVASFEGMPVTDGHPPEGVDTSNIRLLQKGHAHNVRRGTGAEADLLLADLIITDPRLITRILEEGKREISCGYTYELCEENGRFIQRKIRGNHVAVVDAGRAGPRVSIKDHKAQRPERRTTSMKKSLSKILARMAKDGDAETVAEIIEEMMEAEAPETPEPETAGEAAEADAETAGEATLNDVVARLDRIIELLTPAAADENAAEELSEVIEEAIEAAEENAGSGAAAVMEEILDPVSSVIPDVNEEQKLPETLETADALRAALSVIHPALARMPRQTQIRVTNDVVSRLSGKRGSAARDAYTALRSARGKTGPVSAELGRRIMEKRNPNYRP